MGWSSRAGARVVAGSVALVVVSGGSAWASPTSASAASAEAVVTATEPLDMSGMDRTQDGYLFASDGGRAAALAVASGEPVEDLSSRGESGETLWLPDGTIALGQSSGPRWLQTGGDGTALEDWAPVDTTLVFDNGLVRPVAVPGDVVVSAGGAGDATSPQSLVELTAEDGTRQSLGWEGDLPTPVLDGPRATWQDAAGAGVDVVVEVNTSGAEVFFVIAERPASEVELPVQVASEGGVRSDGAGGLELLGSDGATAASVVPEPLMWDAVADGDRSHPVAQDWVAGTRERTPLPPAGWGGVSDAALERVEAASVYRSAVADEPFAAPSLSEPSSFAAPSLPTSTDSVESEQAAEVAGTDDVDPRVAAAAGSLEPESDRQFPVGVDLQPLTAGADEGAAAAMAESSAIVSMSEEPTSQTEPAAVVAEHPEAVRMVLRPDMGFLNDPDTVYPVIVDPELSRSGFDTWVQSDSTVDKSNEVELRVGTHNGSVVARSFLQFPTAEVAGRVILDAHIALWASWSYSCEARGWEFWHTGGVGTGTRWNTQPSWLSYQSTSYDTRGHDGSCGAAWVGISARSQIQWAADHADPQMTFGLKASNEGDMYGWKKFNSGNAGSGQPYLWLRVEDKAPSLPTVVKVTSPNEIPCVVTPPYPKLRSTPTIYWQVDDPDDDPVAANLDIVNIDTGGFAWDAWDGDGTQRPKNSNNEFTIPVPVGTLTPNGRFEFRTGGQDADSGAFGPMKGCRFVFDPVAPEPPTVTSSDYPATEGGGVGVVGKFTFTPAASDTDVARYAWGFDDPATAEGYHTAADRSLDVWRAPQTAGPHYLYVRAIDDAGNASEPTTYKFDVAEAVEDGTWTFDDQSATYHDSSGRGALPLVPSAGAPAREQGALTEFGARTGDLAFSSDGDDWAATSGPVIDTRESFVVSARVRLDPAAVGTGRFATAVGQDGENVSGFELGYRDRDCPAGAAGPGCWSFTMFGADWVGTSVQANSTDKVNPGTWVQLVAVHDARRDEISLRVCDVGVAEAPGSAIPGDAATRGYTSSWYALGGLTVGRHKQGDGNWRGLVDDVRVFTGEVLGPAKIRRLCQGAEATDFAADPATGFASLDPTVNDSVEQAPTAPFGPLESLWTTSDTPAVVNEATSRQITVGTLVKVAAPGLVTGIRFYKGSQNTGVHTGYLWTTGETLLASGTFTGETASGWQTLKFADPVAVSAGAELIVGYHAPVGRYSTDYNGMATSRTRGALTTPAPGGVFVWDQAGFPGGSTSDGFWVDVLFTPAQS